MGNMYTDILEGHRNEILGKNEGLGLKRMEVCESCPLYYIDKILGKRCNGKLWLNPKTNETSKESKEGYLKGCGCRLSAKTKLEQAKCPVGKW